MRTRRWAWAGALLAAATASAAACGGDGAPVGPTPTAYDSVGRLALSRDTATLTVGQTIHLQARAYGRSGAELAGRAVTWASTSQGVARVADGIVEAVAPGTAEVTAESEGRRATMRVTVIPVAPPPPPPPPMQEARALWVNRFEYGPTPAKIAEIMGKAKAAGFNVVYFQVRGQGDAYYASDLEPCAVALCGSLGNGQPSWDPLAAAVQEAHARGLQLHAWVNAFTAWASPTTNTASFCALLRESAAGAPRHMLRAHPEWAMVSSGSPGTAMSCANSQAYEYAYVSPGIPAARTHLARVAADIARRYAVDGVHLDRVRYPGQLHSYDAPSLEAFRARHGRAPTSATADAAWAAFRQEQVSLAVKEVHDSVRAARASAALSAAVWGIYRDDWGWNSSQGLTQYYQDPRAWAAGGYLDVAVPMTYYKTAPSRCAFADWSCLLDDHLAGVQTASGRHVYIGITAAPLSGETAATAPARVVSQIELARTRGAKGVAIYSYNAVESTGLWSVLASGPFKATAVVPGMGWR